MTLNANAILLVAFTKLFESYIYFETTNLEYFLSPLLKCFLKLLKAYLKAYHGESKNRLQFLCLYNFQSHHPLRVLLLHVNYIHIQLGSDNFQGLTI